MEYTLELNFFNFHCQNIEYFKLPFMEKTKIPPNGIEIVTVPREYFKYGEHKKYTIFSLLDKDSQIINQSCFFLYKGNTIAYVETFGNNRSYELIFENKENIEIKIGGKKFDKLDSLGTLNRKRLTLINYGSTNVEINKKMENFLDIIDNNFDNSDKSQKNENKKDDTTVSKSYQISIKNLEKEIYIVKEIKDFKKLELVFKFKKM